MAWSWVLSNFDCKHKFESTCRLPVHLHSVEVTLTEARYNFKFCTEHRLQELVQLKKFILNMWFICKNPAASGLHMRTITIKHCVQHVGISGR